MDAGCGKPRPGSWTARNAGSEPGSSARGTAGRNGGQGHFLSLQPACPSRKRRGLRYNVHAGTAGENVDLKQFLEELNRRNVLRVAAAYLVLAWLVVQVASVMLPTFEAPAWVMRVIVLLLGAGFVATVIFTWVFEMTRGGLKREHEVERNAWTQQRTARKLDMVVIALLIAAIGIGVLTRNRAPTPNPAPAADAPAAVAAVPVAATRPADTRPSVAVLPFVNMSALAENEYFADGLSETLLNMLAQVSGLKVAARTSAFAFKGTKTDIREIARTLEVHTVLEGSVQRSGERVRITAQLIDAKDGSHLWSKSYDRDLDDIFAIQDEIAKEVAAELSRSLLGPTGNAAAMVKPVETHDTDAYDLYLRGLQQRNLNSYGSLPKAERLLKEALAVDPEFGEARIALARTYSMMSGTGLLDYVIAARRGRAVLAPLLGRKPAHPVAEAYDAGLQWEGSDTAYGTEALRRAQQAVSKALEQAPNEIELYALATLVFGQEEDTRQRALEIAERGLELDPLSNNLLGAKGRQLRSLRRYEEALAAYARVREVAPESPNGYNGAALTYEQWGSHADAALWYSKSAAIDRDDHELPAGVAKSLLLIGLVAEARPWLERATLLNPDGSDTRRVRLQYAEQSGDHAGAIELAREVILERRDNRRFVYGIAVSTYLQLMHESGKSQEALALLEQAAPGMVGIDAVSPRTEIDFVVRWVAAVTQVADRSREANEAIAAKLVADTLVVEPDFDPDKGMRGVLLRVMRGEVSAAATLFQEVLGDPRELPTNWRLFVRIPAMREVARDPGVIAAIGKLEADFAKQAQRYRELLAAGEVALP